MKGSKWVFLLNVLIIFFCTSLSAEEIDELDSVTVLELRAVDGYAVVQSTDGKRVKIKKGDAIPGTNAGVVEILPDKMVIEDVIEKEDAIVKQSVLIYLPDIPGGKSKVQRLEHQGYARKALSLPSNE